MIIVSQNALIERVNRKLAQQDQRLLKARGGAVAHHPWGWRNRHPVLGRYGVVDLRTSTLMREVPEEEDLEELGREVGALSAGEQLGR